MTCIACRIDAWQSVGKSNAIEVETQADRAVELTAK